MTNKDIIETEIKELEQQPINYNVAEKLAWLYIVRDHFGYDTSGFVLSSNTDFALAVQSKNILDVLVVVDELMSTLEVLSPKLYGATIEKLNNLRTGT